MKATLSDRIYLTELSAEQSETIQQALTFRNPKHAEAQQQGRSTYGVPRMLELFEIVPGGLVVPRGVSLLIGVTKIDDQRNTHPVKISSTIKPRPYQERAIRLATNASGGKVLWYGSGRSLRFKRWWRFLP